MIERKTFRQKIPLTDRLEPAALAIFVRMRTLSTVLLLLLFLAGCNSERQVDPSLDIAAADTLENEYAKGFRFVALEDGMLLEIMDLEGDSTRVIQRLYRGIPTNDLPQGTLQLRAEQMRLATLSTTQIAMIQAVDGLPHLQGTAYASYVRDEQVKAMLDAGEIRDLSGDQDIDFEAILELSPDAFLVYPYGQEDYSKYERADIPCVRISEYLEEHPLGRAEWVKVIGFLIEKEALANQVFDQIAQAYEETRTLALHTADQRGAPEVFTGSHSNGMWYAAPGDSFIARFIQDAGGSYVFSDYHQKENISLQFEELFERVYETAYWGKVVFEEGELTLEKIREGDDRLKDLHAFKEKQIFYCNAAEEDYFGAAVMEPHLILEDLVAILHPDLIPNHEPHYFKLIRQ